MTIHNIFTIILAAASYLSCGNTFAVHPIELAERKEAIEVALSVGLLKPYRIERVAAEELLKNFDSNALNSKELAMLAAMGSSSPLCGQGDKSKMHPCPAPTGLQFGRLNANGGGCMWAPRYGIPARPQDRIGPFIGISDIRCGKGTEWNRIQKTTLPHSR